MKRRLRCGYVWDAIKKLTLFSCHDWMNLFGSRRGMWRSHFKEKRLRFDYLRAFHENIRRQKSLNCLFGEFPIGGPKM
jgi:hypothetical protein